MPPSTVDYATLAQVKASLNLTGQTYADADISLAITAASRAIDNICGRRFYLDADVNQIRYYTPESACVLEVDDIAVLTGVAIDRGGNGSFTETWTNNVDFVLEPLNAQSVSTDLRPYERIRTRFNTRRLFPYWIERSVQVTAQFGWATVPPDVQSAAEILTSKVLRRVREAPFGIVTVGIEQDIAVRISRTDPELVVLLDRFSRRRPFV